MAWKAVPLPELEAAAAPAEPVGVLAQGAQLVQPVAQAARAQEGNVEPQSQALAFASRGGFDTRDDFYGSKVAQAPTRLLQRARREQVRSTRDAARERTADTLALLDSATR